MRHRHHFFQANRGEFLSCGGADEPSIPPPRADHVVADQGTYPDPTPSVLPEKVRPESVDGYQPLAEYRQLSGTSSLTERRATVDAVAFHSEVEAEPITASARRDTSPAWDRRTAAEAS